MNINDLKCCGNCKNNYKSSTKCIPVESSPNKMSNYDYESDDLCDNWEFDNKTESERN